MRIDWRALRLAWTECPKCDGTRPFVRLFDDEVGVRCMQCRASAVTLSIVSVLCKLVPDLSSIDALELSSRGPLVRFLRPRVRSLVTSEYFPGIESGEFVRGIRCEDVQRLSFTASRFDLCTSTEVLEHVPDDAAAFAELFRVLRPAGVLAFTVPLLLGSNTLQRARRRADGSVDHHLSPEYHADPRSGSAPVLTYRTYGRDILDRLRTAGFAGPRIDWPDHRIPWNRARPVVVALKPADARTLTPSLSRGAGVGGNIP
jgi:SAM-dependent methyltransferase